MERRTFYFSETVFEKLLRQGFFTLTVDFESGNTEVLRFIISDELEQDFKAVYEEPEQE